MIIHGKNPIEEALNAGGAGIEKIYIYKGVTNNALVEKIKKSGIQYQFTDKAAIDRIAKTGGHQGFVATVADYKYFGITEMIESAYAKGSQPVILILDGVEDPHNLGNIIRTAECMGVDGIVIPKNRSVAVTETVVRVSAGSAIHMKVSKVTNISTEIEYLKEQGFWVYAATMGGTNIAQTNLQGPIAIIMGGEHTGVRHQTKANSDGIISIPMKGKINSLNVANATAMVLYEVNRQRYLK